MQRWLHPRAPQGEDQAPACRYSSLAVIANREVIHPFPLSSLARERLSAVVQDLEDTYLGSWQDPPPKTAPLRKANEDKDREALLTENMRLREMLKEAVKLFPKDEDSADSDSDSDSDSDRSSGDIPEDHACTLIDEPTVEEEDEQKKEARRKYPPGSEKEPLHNSTELPILSAVLLLFNWKQQHLISDVGFEGLLTLLARILLPEGNRCPPTLFLAEGILEAQAQCVKRDVCVNECHLFGIDEMQCPVCGQSRYEATGPRKGKARRSFETFPIANQLRAHLQDEDFVEGLREMAEFLKTDPSAEETIWAGKLFAPFREQGKILSNVEEGFALSLGMDGAPTFVTGTGTLWVMVLKIWNLPAAMRTDKRYRLFFAVIEGTTLVSKQGENGIIVVFIFFRPEEDGSIHHRLIRRPRPSPGRYPHEEEAG